MWCPGGVKWRMFWRYSKTGITLSMFSSGSNFIFAGLTIIIGALSLHLGNLRAGKRLHATMLRNIVCSPMRFFEATPCGRVLNRFGKDIDTIDTVLPVSLRTFLQLISKALSGPVIVAWVTPMFLVAAIPLAFLYFVAQVSRSKVL